MLQSVVGPARWKIAATGLAAQELADIRMMPGVVLDHTGISAPWNALPVLWDLFTVWGRPLVVTSAPTVHLPRPWGPEHFEELAGLLFKAGMRPGLVTGGEPFGLLGFQLEAVWNALELGSCLIKEDPGAGKTVQALACALVAARRAASQAPLPVLVVTPPAVLRQYTRQVTRLTLVEGYTLMAPSSAPQRNGVKLSSADQLAMYFYAHGGSPRPAVVLVGWDSLDLHLPALRNVQWGAVVWDEIQLGKQGKREHWAKTSRGLRATFHGSRSAAAYQLALRIPYRFGTTATPIFDRRNDLYGVATLIDPTGWGRTQKRFLIRYTGAHEGRHGWEADDRTWTDELDTRLHRIMHQVPREVSHANLPPTLIEVVYIPTSELDPEPKGYGKEVTALANKAKAGSLEALSQLRELRLMVSAARKRTRVVRDAYEWLQEQPDAKILQMTGRHRDCWDLAASVRNVLEDPFDFALEGEDEAPTVPVWCGVEEAPGGFTLPTDARREELQDTYMSRPGPVVLTVTLGAWGTGLDFQDTDLMQVVMLPPNPGPLIQTLGRVGRLGQQRPCVVRIYVGEGTADDDMVALFGDKSEDLIRLLGDLQLEGLPQALRGVADLGEAIQRVMDKCRAAWSAPVNNDLEDL